MVDVVSGVGDVVDVVDLVDMVDVVSDVEEEHHVEQHGRKQGLKWKLGGVLLDGSLMSVTSQRSQELRDLPSMLPGKEVIPFNTWRCSLTETSKSNSFLRPTSTLPSNSDMCHTMDQVKVCLVPFSCRQSPLTDSILLQTESSQ